MDLIEHLDHAAVLNLHPEDLIVVRVKTPLAAEMVAEIERRFREKLPAAMRDLVGLVVVDAYADIGVLRGPKSDDASQ